MTQSTKKTVGPFGGPQRHRDPEPWEIQILVLISEQSAIPMDLLARFLKISRQRAAGLMEEFARFRWVRVHQFYVADEPWVWLRQAGVRHADTRFPQVPLTVNNLSHRRALCAIRLHLESLHPEGTWVCERAVSGSKRKQRSRHFPDAVFEVHNEHGELERWAIEAELSLKQITRYRQIVVNRCRRFDRLIYFCTPRVRKVLARVPGLLDNPQVDVLRFFKNPSSVKNFQWVWSPESAAGETSPRRHAKAWEAKVLKLISEQLAIPVDQLARFMECDQEAAQRIADHLEKAGFVYQAYGPAGEPAWLWVTRAGARLSGTGLPFSCPRLSILERLRLENEVRLYVAERDPNVRWWSRRRLRRGIDTRAVPMAITESENEQEAIELEYRRRATFDIVAKYNKRCAEFPAAVSVFCASRRAKSLERLKRERGWHNLHVVVLDELNRLPADRRKCKPKPPAEMYKANPDDIPPPAIEAVQNAEQLSTPPAVNAAFRFCGRGSERWCVVTNSGSWYAVRMPLGWFAFPFEEGQAQLVPRPVPQPTPSKPSRMKQISVASLPAEALDAIMKATGSKATPKVTLVKKRREAGHPCWRVLTDQGKWRVTHIAGRGWFAKPTDDGEVASSPVTQCRWPRDPDSAMVNVELPEIPSQALEAITEAAGLASAPEIRSAQRNTQSDPPRWRLETDSDTWRVTHGSHGWIASPSE